MSDELTNGIYVSINPEPTFKIVQGTKNHELRHLSEVMTDFTEESIQKRTAEIMAAFLKYLSENELLK